MLGIRNRFVPWNRTADFTNGHLVLGVHKPDRLDRVRLISKYLERAQPMGRYAVRASDERGEPVVQIVFEIEADATKVASTLGARHAIAHLGWDSQRTFSFGSEVAGKVEKLLGD